MKRPVLFARGWLLAVPAGVLFVVAEGVLVADGARTSAIIPLASIAILGIIRFRSFSIRTALVIIMGLIIAAVTSSMYLFRAIGLASSTSSYGVVYHQDDSIYRVWVACSVADQSVVRWDPFYFFYYILSLPIPRAIWASKPLLDQNFYGEFKVWYVTTTFMGEWISMFGVLPGFGISFLFACLVYRGFYFSHRLLAKPLGVTAYILVALYVYMVLRSMPSLTTFIYAPAAAILMVFFARKSVTGARKRRPSLRYRARLIN